MFQGHASVSIDEKGRIIIPSKFRKHILPEANNQMIVVPGRDRCLWMYPSNEWNRLIGKLLTQNTYTANVISMQRQMLSNLEECNIDAQHRVLISQKLLLSANIRKEVLLIGLLTRIELWDQKEYDNYLKGLDKTYEEVMEIVMKESENARNEH